MNNYDDLLNNAPAEGQQNSQLSKEDYAAKKKAERDEIFALSDNTALEVAGDGGKFRQYLDVQSNFDRYSAVNALLILAQKPESTRLADFDNWKGQGASVKLGQSGISILEPHEYTKEDGKPGIGYNVKKVFDISQIDTKKLNKTSPPPTYTERQILSALISRAPVKITGVDELPGDMGAMTDPQTGEISVRRGMQFADSFKSVAQELVYPEIEQSNNEPSDPRFSAYCASYILCKKYGVDTKDFNFNDAPGVFKGMEPQAVKTELTQIRDAAESINGRMTKQLDTLNKAAKNNEAR